MTRTPPTAGATTLSSSASFISSWPTMAVKGKTGRAAEGFPPLLLLERPAMQTGNEKENRGARGIINSSGRNGREIISDMKFSSGLDGHAEDVRERAARDLAVAADDDNLIVLDRHAADAAHVALQCFSVFGDDDEPLCRRGRGLCVGGRLNGRLGRPRPGALARGAS